MKVYHSNSDKEFCMLWEYSLYSLIKYFVYSKLQ